MVQILILCVTFLSLFTLQSSSVACDESHEVHGKTSEFIKPLVKGPEPSKFTLPPLRDRTNSTPSDQGVLGRVRILEAGSSTSRKKPIYSGISRSIKSFSPSSIISKISKARQTHEEYGDNVHHGDGDGDGQPNLGPEPGPSYNSVVSPPVSSYGGGNFQVPIPTYASYPSSASYTTSPKPPIPPGGGYYQISTASPSLQPPEPEPTSDGGGETTEIPIIGGGDGDEDNDNDEEEEEEGVHPPAPPPFELGLNPPSIINNNINQEHENLEFEILKPIGSPLARRKGRVRTSPLRQSDLRINERLRDFTNNRAPILPVPDDPNIIMDFSFSNIKCFRTNKREYFGANIHLKNGFHLPYIRDKPSDTMESSDCRLERAEPTNSYHMTINDLKKCGVEQCGESMCITMVFPRVPTLALAEDEVTTIKCLPQKPTMSEAKTISFAGDSLESRRSSSTVEGGGQEFAAEVGVFRQNAGANNGLFTKRVNSGGVVQLGEALQLRSVVRGGDGWSHSRLSDVKVWRMRDSFNRQSKDLDPSDASEVITLVDSNGCRNPEYQVIAEVNPVKDPRNDLVYHFTFKAFLFRGQRANEPLIVTSKVKACQDEEECHSICDLQEGSSNLHPSLSTLAHTRRFKRSKPVEIKNISSIVHDFSTQMALRVVGLKDQSASITEEDFPLPGDENYIYGKTPLLFCAERMLISAFIGGFIVFLLAGIVFAVFSYIRKSKKSNPQNLRPRSYFQHPQIQNGNPTQTQNQNQNQPSLQNQNQNSDHGGFQSTSTHRKRLTNFVQELQPRSRQPLNMSENSKKLEIFSKPLPSIPPGSIPGGSSTTIISTTTGKGNLNPQVKIIGEKSDGQEKLFTKSEVAKLLKRLNSTELGGKDRGDSEGDGETYETIENLKSKQIKQDENGFYIVYCCTDGSTRKMKNSASAPGSLRRNRRKMGKNQAISASTGELLDGSISSDFVDEDSDDSYGFGDGDMKSKIRPGSQRRTVRSVKRSNLKNRIGIRRRLSSFYREMNRRSFHSTSTTTSGSNTQAKYPSGGSFPSSRVVSTTRENPVKKFEDSSEIVTSDFEFDSAYCSSTISSSNLTNTPSTISTSSVINNLPPVPPPKKPPVRRGANYVNYPPNNSNYPKRQWDHQGSHIVTQNEQSTQILILPETNV